MFLGDDIPNLKDMPLHNVICEMIRCFWEFFFSFEFSSD